MPEIPVPAIRLERERDFFFQAGRPECRDAVKAWAESDDDTDAILMWCPSTGKTGLVYYFEVSTTGQSVDVTNWKNTYPQVTYFMGASYDGSDV